MTDMPTSRTNRELIKALKPPRARFYPCDLHVHSLGSFDASMNDRFAGGDQSLSADISSLMDSGAVNWPLTSEPSNLGQFDKSVAQLDVVKRFYQSLVERRNAIAAAEGISESDNWSIIGITDHNTSHFSCALSEHSWEQRTSDRLVTFPGMELEVHFQMPQVDGTCKVHLLCLFAPLTSASDIRIAIIEAASGSGSGWDFGAPLAVQDLPGFISGLRLHTSYPAICIGAHVWSNKGIENEPKETMLASINAEIIRLAGELDRLKYEGLTSEVEETQTRIEQLSVQREDNDSIHMEVLSLIGSCGLDALQVRDQTHETHYRRLHRFRELRGRSIPIVCSDAHSPSHVFSCASEIPYAKVSSHTLANGTPQELFRELREQTLRFGETRTTYAAPGTVNAWIDGIEIARDASGASEFWSNQVETDSDSTPEFLLPLSRNLNCLVGGRGSGKSAVVEAIAFLTQEKLFTDEGNLRDRDQSDAYKRAVATLAGCRLRMVWKTSGNVGIGGLPKKALIVSRYFDVDGRHESLDFRDIDGNAIVDDSITLPSARILRAHEIEETARPENLKSLFDDLCGKMITRLSDDIEDIREQLVEQRSHVVEVCESLSALTRDGSPLRQYGIRKQQFDAVNKPELRTRYEEIDAAEAVAKVTSQAHEGWSNLRVADNLHEIESSVSEFLTSTSKKLVDDDGIPMGGMEDLHGLVAAPNPDSDSSEEQIDVARAIASARETANSMEQSLDEVQSKQAEKLAEKQAELAKEGLPTGSSERAAKKKAFDAAKQAFDKYEQLLDELKEALVERDKLHGKIVEKCRERTELRKRRAEELTSDLERDLDQNILRIEIDACPMADRQEFSDWLENHVEPTFGRYKSHRREALLHSGVMPKELRTLLLDDGFPSLTALKIDRERAEDGRIEETDAEKILERCRGQKKVPLEESDTWDSDFLDSLPSSIRQGVVTFPRRSGAQSLCIEHVLELDEIVLDDIPEVRLNDRPKDPSSEPRPLSRLSPGQRCSAILPILLLSGEFPLVIDQPEENLDNRLVRQVIVNILASMKLKRQVIIATHNPNLPVLGDSEQCVVLQARGRDMSEVVAAGNLDAPDVAHYITDIMEGGREAFQYRQAIYQTHWKGVVARE
ncbi:AAA family ATPase [Thalassoroseus pseudoceratinae]|uniref:AAA family ATPase n=1 Tax=Thalassoroseus pseudoceratinae TaxID=2713176 RepID=UPI0014217E36|nr:hypothetical protein [Thalassoroseus pseudoceratinae]